MHLTHFIIGEGIKICSFSAPSSPMPDSPHTFVTPSKITRASQASEPPPAHQEAFEKTFALFCSITLEGCAAQLLTSDQSSDGPEDATAGSTSESVGTPDSDSESIQGDREVLPADSDTDHIDTPDQQRGGEEEVDHRHTVRPTRSKRPLGCRGQIVAKKEKTTGKTYLWYIDFLELGNIWCTY